MRTMPRTKELNEDLQARIFELHKAGKGYKSISKSLDVHVSTVRQIIYKWREFKTVATLPGGGRPTKMTARVQRRLVSEVRRNPRASAKDLKQSLAHAKISVHTSTIRKTLNNNGVHGRTPMRFLCGVVLFSKKEHCCTSKVCKITLMFHSSSGKTFFGQMKQKLSYLEGTHNAMYGERMAQHTSNKTSSQL